MKMFYGCGAALITPFKKSGAVDYARFRTLVIRQITSGVDFLVPIGTTGEVSCLEDEEKLELLKVAVSNARGNLPVIAPIISNNTEVAITQIKLFQKVGVDGFLVITPYYNKPMPNGLYNYFKKIALSTDRPIILYNLPSCTSVNLTAATCLKLAEIKNIIGVKDGSGNYQQISEIISNAPLDFTVLSGRDNEALSLIATGAKGVISGIANVAPREISNFIRVLLSNDFVSGRKIYYQLLPLFTACSLETNPIVVKAAMHKMGLVDNILRSPLYPATKKSTDIIVEVIKRLGLL